MAARPALKKALGREAVYHEPPAPPPDQDGKAKARYEDTHMRATYHLPRALVEAVAEESASSGRSKARVVADALRQHLGSAG